MNSAMRPIFNDNFVEKKRFVGPKNSAWDLLKSTKTHFSMKKKRETLDVDCTEAVGPTNENAKNQNVGIETLSK